jgi:hypothetical protein
MNAKNATNATNASAASQEKRSNDLLQEGTLLKNTYNRVSNSHAEEKTKLRKYHKYKEIRN